MAPEVMSAIIGSVVSVILSVWSVFTSKTAKSFALRAEENAKQTEQVRVKALSASEDLFQAISAIRDQIATYGWLIDKAGGVTEKDVLDNVKEYSEHLKTLKNVYTRTMVYWTPDI